MSLDAILTNPALAGMRAERQWMIYTAFPDPKKPGKLKKLPLHPVTGAPCSVVESANWTDVETAAAAVRQFGHGFGLAFCFVEGSGRWFLDLDGCKQADGTWSPLAQQLVTKVLPGAALEVSASGNGLHLFGRGTVPAHRCKNAEQNAELYTDERFCAMTGTALQGDCDTDFSAAMPWVVATYFAPKNAGALNLPDDGPVPEWRGPTDDAELLRRMLQSKSVASKFGAATSASFAELWDRDLEALHRFYPGDGEGGIDWSSVDAALAQMLCFWTGKDRARMVRLMLQSGLVRSKWEDREDYLPRTAASACGMQRDVLGSKTLAGSPQPPAAVPVLASAHQTPRHRHQMLAGVPLEAARALLERDYSHPDGDRLKTWQGVFYRWDGAGWIEMTTDDVRAMLYRFLEREANTTYTPTQSKVTNLLDALKAAAHLDSKRAPPCWADGRQGPQPRELMACANGLLHLPTRTLHPPTPAFFSTNAAHYNYRADALPPVHWLSFLHQLWPEDPEPIATLQEVFGYLLTPDTSQQKLFLIIGPKRSGKGTIGRVLARLLGEDNVTSPSLSSLGADFGLQPLIGKLAAIVSDARLGGRADSKAITENLLRLSGEDRVEVNRKHLSSITLQLAARFVLLTNELPRLADSSGAMASRFIVLKMSQSFYGKEDPGLTGHLLEELPGILNWAIEGWQRLRVRGYFVTPRSSLAEAQEMADLGSPVLAFVREVCEMAPTVDVDVDALYQAWKIWCAEQGVDRVASKQVFGTELGHAVDGLTTRQRPRPSRARYYVGIGLRHDWHALARVAMHCSPALQRAA